MATVKQLLDLARSYLGCKESDGSHKKIIDVYNAHTPLARNYKVKYTDSWCAVFVSALAIKCGCTDIIPTECSCGNMINLFKNIGCWQENQNVTPNPGDIIFYDWDKKDGWPEHVGIVESVSGNQITVIEGNKNDAVARRTINVGSSSIRGYGVPKYDDSVTVAPTPQPTPQPAPQPAQTSYKVKVDTPSGVNCRNAPNGAKIKAYANGTVLNITQESNGWGFTGEGWVSLQYCARIQDAPAPQPISKLGTYKVTASDLIVRNVPNGKPVGHSKLSNDGKKHDKDKDGALDRGTCVTIMEIRDGWGKCPSGWISMKYLKKV